MPAQAAQAVAVQLDGSAAATPRKHVLVSRLFGDEDGSLRQAVPSRRCERIPWRDLQDRPRWLMGWNSSPGNAA